MEKEALEQYYDNFVESFHKSTLVAFGTPDQFQYRQNCLLQAMAEFMIAKYGNEFIKENEGKLDESN